MNRVRSRLVLISLLPGCVLLALAIGAARRTRAVPGSVSGTTLLPNGWRIAPAGRHLTVGDLPLAMAEPSDGRYVLVSNNGYAKPTLAIVDLRSTRPACCR